MSTETPAEGERLHAVEMSERTPVMRARNLVKRYGRVTALNGSDLELYPGEILAVIGDNGAGKSSLIKALSGAWCRTAGRSGWTARRSGSAPRWTPHGGDRDGVPNPGGGPRSGHRDNLFLGREIRKPGPLGSVLRMLDRKQMRSEAQRHMGELGIATLQNIGQAVESLSGGQRQGVAVARSALRQQGGDPRRADRGLGVKEGNRVLQLIRDVRDRGLPVILISHNMPHVFEVADRIHIQRLAGGSRWSRRPATRCPTRWRS